MQPVIQLSKSTRNPRMVDTHSIISYNKGIPKGDDLMTFTETELRIALTNEYAYLRSVDADDVMDTTRTVDEYIVYLNELDYEECIAELFTDDEDEIQEFVDTWKDNTTYR